MPAKDYRAEARGLIESLRAAGLNIWLENGTVKGKTADGRKLTPEERIQGNRLKELKCQAIEVLAQEGGLGRISRVVDPPGLVRLTGVPWEEAKPVGLAINAGAAELVGKVYYHPSTMLFDLQYRPLVDDLDLSIYGGDDL